MAGSVVSSVAGSLASKAIGGLMGGDEGGSTEAGGPVFLPFRAGGVGASLNHAGQIELRTTQERKDLIDSMRGNLLSTSSGIAGLRPQFQEAFGFGVDGIDNLLSQVTPGFGRLTDSRVQAINNARDRTIGNLQDELRRRRIQGSSFANDSVVRGELEFAQEEEKARAESFLAELELTDRLIQERVSTDVARLQTDLDTFMMEMETARAADELSFEEMNRLAEMALRITTGTVGALSANAQTEAQLAAQGAQGAGMFASQIGNGVSGFVNNLFGGSASGSNFGTQQINWNDGTSGTYSGTGIFMN